MVDIWLAPLLAVLGLSLGGLFLLVRMMGGTGVRTDGKILCDRPGVDEDMPP